MHSTTLIENGIVNQIQTFQIHLNSFQTIQIIKSNQVLFVFKIKSRSELNENIIEKNTFD